MLTVISAVAKNGVIGKDGDIPWRIKEDFARFKKLTWGHPCIMGDRTYISLPKSARPLQGRENIVLTRDKNFSEPGITIFHSWEEALEYVKDKEAYICGGASIYKLGLTVADKLELTRIDKEYEGDTYFPEVNWDEWELVQEDKREGFSFQTYKRKKENKYR